jgi:hypothetical protein
MNTEAYNFKQFVVEYVERDGRCVPLYDTIKRQRLEAEAQTNKTQAEQMGYKEGADPNQVFPSAVGLYLKYLRINADLLNDKMLREQTQLPIKQLRFELEVLPTLAVTSAILKEYNLLPEQNQTIYQSGIIAYNHLKPKLIEGWQEEQQGPVPNSLMGEVLERLHDMVMPDITEDRAFFSIVTRLESNDS